MFSEEFIKIWDTQKSDRKSLTSSSHLKRRLFCPEAHTLDFQPRREEKKSRAIHKVEHHNGIVLLLFENFLTQNCFYFISQNIHKKWHVDLQIYVATFGLLYKEQLKKDSEHNVDDVLSKELFEIFKAARELLCAIEDFVNSTSTERINVDDWFTKKEMRSKLVFKNLTDKLTMHRTYAKGRFQGYIKKLHDRINSQIKSPNASSQPISPNHPKLKALKKRKLTTRRQRNRGSRKNKRPQNGLVESEVSTTKRVHIIRTTNRPTQLMKKKDRTRKLRRSTTTIPNQSTVQ